MFSLPHNTVAYNRLASETDARGITKTHSYEQARSSLLGTTYPDGTTARAYTYNHLGQRTQMTDDAGVHTIAYNTYGEQETDSLVAGEKTHPLCADCPSFLHHVPDEAFTAAPEPVPPLPSPGPAPNLPLQIPAAMA